MRDNPFLLKNNLGYVVPAHGEQFHPDDMEFVVDAIGRAYASELAFIDMARRPDKLEWLPELHQQILDNWYWVESVLWGRFELDPPKGLELN